MSKIELGRSYEDKITGFVGVATGYVEYITGCNQALLQPKVGVDGAYKDSMWFDQQRLTVLDEDVIVLDNGKTPGSDKAAPKR